jgi:hypothetical protein
MDDATASDASRNEGKAIFLKHFSQAFYDELVWASDKDYFHLLGELLDTGVGSPVDMSEEFAGDLLPLSKVYRDIYDEVTYDW